MVELRLTSTTIQATMTKYAFRPADANATQVKNLFWEEVCKQGFMRYPIPPFRQRAYVRYRLRVWLSGF
ncbi:hypothetical protein AJ87_13085 [Rhizobium yanglingense]|nr:hypothetical protein AJ87_13085 [Rhizobium yanglingense]